MSWLKIGNIKGPPGPPGTGAESGIIGEVPSGAVNNINTIFTTALPFSPNSLSVFHNGLRAKAGYDFNVTGPSNFQFTSPPSTGDLLLVDYMME